MNSEQYNNKIYRSSLILALIFAYNTIFHFGVIQKTSLVQAGKTEFFLNVSVKIQFAESGNCEGVSKCKIQLGK